ncbi:hypothetical protein [Mucilaginibacter sp. SP1R1]|uniref:hypothetical protein n=1 Tax=Mucilaginibacter sp. SP1R1 TaxID=2723091 RepID=UPI003B005CAA
MASNQAKNAKHFIVRRILRIFPPYWFSIIIVGIVIICSIVTNGANSIAILPKSGKDILATITLLTTPFSSVPIINWVYWTLTFELFSIF